MSLQIYLTFVVACVALALLPGPNVTLVIANGLRYGTRAALVTISGTQVGLAVVIAIVAFGLTTMMATMGYWFDWVRFIGAAYLVWLGIKLVRAPIEGIDTDTPPAPPRGGFFLQGLGVLLSNPKVLVCSSAPSFRNSSISSKTTFCRSASSVPHSWSPLASPTRSMRLRPAVRENSSRRGARGCCRGSPAAS